MALQSAGTSIRKLTSTTFDPFWAAQNPFCGQNCTLDLRGVKLITPSALVQLAAGCYALAEANRYPTILIEDTSVRSYLHRADFMGAVEPVARFVPQPSRLLEVAYGHRRGGSEMLIEVTKIQTGEALPALIDRIVTVLTDRLRYSKNDAYDVAIAVSEIAQNTFDHNTRSCGFLAMQVYEKAGFLAIGIADHGDGLATTLRKNAKNPPVATDREAITLAIKRGTSEYDDVTRGTGLYHLLEIAYKHEGLAQIRSGSAKVRYRMDKKQGWAFNVAPLPGVQVALNLRTKSRQLTSSPSSATL